MKKIIQFFALSVLLLCCSFSAFSQLPSGRTGNLSWIISSDGILCIDGYGRMPDYQTGYSPWYSYRDEIYSIEISEGVSSIGQAAFQHLSYVGEVEIPRSVTSIGGWAFYGCNSLERILIPGEVRSIGPACFAEDSSLETVELYGLPILGWRCFWHCSSLGFMIVWGDGVPPIKNEYMYGAPNEPFGGGTPCSSLYVYPDRIYEFKYNDVWGKWRSIKDIQTLLQEVGDYDSF